MIKTLRFTALLIALATIPTFAFAQADDPEQTLAEEVGSLRNAKVAIPMNGEKQQLTYFASSMSEENLKDLKRVAPNLKIVTGLSRTEALKRAGEAHGVESRYASDEFLKKADNLVWIQAMSAGVDSLIGREPIMGNNKLILTNHRGVHGPAIADHAMAMLLFLTRDMRKHAENQLNSEWNRGDFELNPVALDGQTLLVVGLGGIGSEIAKRGKAFGMTVWATRRSEAPKPDYVDRVELSGELTSMLPKADVVALALPLTPETKGMFDKKTFATMKDKSYFINIARGAIANQDDLIQALKSGKLAGAGLDVTDPEPLPADSPLWKMRNVIITPHVAGRAEVTGERRWALVRANLSRFAAGKPLYNVVDKEAGY